MPELENFKCYKVGYRQTGCRVDMQQSCICPDRVNRGVIRLCLRQVWAAPLMGGARAVVMFNRHVSSDEKFDEHNMTLHWSMIGLPVDLAV